MVRQLYLFCRSHSLAFIELMYGYWIYNVGGFCVYLFVENSYIVMSLNPIYGRHTPGSGGLCEDFLS